MVAPLLLNGMDCTDVRMVQRRRRAGFSLKAFDQLGVLRHGIRQEFHGHPSAEPRVFGFVYHTHAAAAERSCHLIMRNGLRYSRIGSSHVRTILFCAPPTVKLALHPLFAFGFRKQRRLTNPQYLCFFLAMTNSRSAAFR